MKAEINNITYRIEFRHEHLQIALPARMWSSPHSAGREQQLRMFISSQLPARYAAGVEALTTAAIFACGEAHWEGPYESYSGSTYKLWVAGEVASSMGGMQSSLFGAPTSEIRPPQIETASRVVALGWAFQQSVDQFHPEIGRRIALRRALGTSHEGRFSGPVRAAIWQAYFSDRDRALPATGNKRKSVRKPIEAKGATQ